MVVPTFETDSGTDRVQAAVRISGEACSDGYSFGGVGQSDIPRHGVLIRSILHVGAIFKSVRGMDHKHVF